MTEQNFKTVYEFIDSLGEVWKPIDSNILIFIYNGHRCQGELFEESFAGMLLSQTVKITPVEKKHDIGNGPGIPVEKVFRFSIADEKRKADNEDLSFPAGVL